jgi:hypothetical protein
MKLPVETNTYVEVLSRETRKNGCVFAMRPIPAALIKVVYFS